MISKKAVQALLVSAVALTVGAATVAKAEGSATEKCYGVAKAAKNDCAAADKSHSCAGQATADASKSDFLKVPAGLCEKLAGGSTAEPKAQ